MLEYLLIQNIVTHLDAVPTPVSSDLETQLRSRKGFFLNKIAYTAGRITSP